MEGGMLRRQILGALAILFALLAPSFALAIFVFPKVPPTAPCSSRRVKAIARFCTI
jgi:hypothetical protein